MRTITLIGHVDEQHRLSAEVPESVAPGPVKVIVEVTSDEDDADKDAWAAAIARAWAADWNDPREDIYTLEDGEPSDGTR